MTFYTGSGNTVTFGESGSDGIRKTAPWTTVIHRGWVAGAKENTLPAFWLTKENGYGWGECDVRFSADGVPVLAHNATIVSEDGNTTLTVANSTLEQLQSVTLQTHDRFGEIKMPTLAELLAMARLMELNILLDLKTGTAADMTALAQVVLSSGWSDHVVYMPTSTANAAAIAAVDRNASFDFVTSVTAAENLPDLAPYEALLTGANTVGFDFNASVTDANGGLPQTLYDAVRAAGLFVSFWNIRSSAYKTYMDAGPLRITKQNTADKTDLDELYLADKQYW